MGNDNNWARGFFNNNAFVYVFPGDGSLNFLLAGVVHISNLILPTQQLHMPLQLVGVLELKVVVTRMDQRPTLLLATIKATRCNILLMTSVFVIF